VGIEKMVMMNIVGPINEIDNIARELTLMGNVHIVNAINEIDESNFTLGVQEENINELVEMNVIQPYRSEEDFKEMFLKTNNLVKYLDIKPTIQKDLLMELYLFGDRIKEINDIYDEVEGLYRSIERSEEILKELQQFENHIKYLKEFDMDLDQLNNMVFFNYKIGILSKENRLKLKNNYENTCAVVFHIGSNNVGEVYLIISPKKLEVETDRILRSLYFQELDMSREFSGTPVEVIKKVQKKIDFILEEHGKQKEKLSHARKNYENIVVKAYSCLKMEEATLKIKSEIARTSMFFYLSGWVLHREKQEISERITKHNKQIIIMFKETNEVEEFITPPTKLKNNSLLRPFESLVKMYGVPSYDEMDPTIFLSITYMLLFGAMFGDVGQGLVIFLAGIYFSRKPGTKLIGGILNRLGLSSIVFGFLYGSIFGFEYVIPALLIHPMESINEMLISSVVLGVILLGISYYYGITNHLRQKNIKEGIFGRNGIVGFIFYILFLTLGMNMLLGKEFLPNTFIYILMLICIALIVVREPLTNYIRGHRPYYHESVSEYYIESSFDILEILLNMLSSTISFIRVGAFALNHVALFIAFQTIAKMLNDAVGSVIVIIIANVFIIGLEGLVVFIQGLRLEYYEMFSKYYKGEGIEFDPVKLE